MGTPSTSYTRDGLGGRLRSTRTKSTTVESERPATSHRSLVRMLTLGARTGGPRGGGRRPPDGRTEGAICTEHMGGPRGGASWRAYGGSDAFEP